MAELTHQEEQDTTAEQTQHEEQETTAEQTHQETTAEQTHQETTAAEETHQEQQETTADETHQEQHQSQVKCPNQAPQEPVDDEQCEIALVEKAYLYLTKATYPEGTSKNEKRSIRRKAERLKEQNGELYYKKRGGVEVSKVIHSTAENLFLLAMVLY